LNANLRINNCASMSGCEMLVWLTATIIISVYVILNSSVNSREILLPKPFPLLLSCCQQTLTTKHKCLKTISSWVLFIPGVSSSGLALHFALRLSDLFIKRFMTNLRRWSLSDFLVKSKTIVLNGSVRVHDMNGMTFMKRHQS
jgi:hypothetical protein